LGRGFLTGRIRRVDDLQPDDYRRTSPRFQGDNLVKNLSLVERVQALAKEKGVTASQLALACVLARGEDIVPIPGTKRRRYLEENARAAMIELTADDLERIEDIAPRGVAVGSRYPEAMMQMVNR
jgi:aryl-alcohol dehydrogenase-like predicted oxidoreductase